MHDSLLDKGKLLMKKTISHFHPSHSHATSAATTTTTSTNNNTTTITNNNSTTVTATTNTSATELDEFGDITRSSLSVGYSSNSLSDFGDITDTTRRSGKDSSDSPEGEEEHEEETLSAYPTSYKSKLKSRLTNLANHYHKDAEIAELRSQLESKTQELTLLKQEFAKFKKDKELEISSLLLTIDKLRVQNDSELASYTASPVASSTTEASQSPLKKVEPELESEPESKKLGSDSGKETLVHDISSNSLNSFTSASFV